MPLAKILRPRTARARVAPGKGGEEPMFPLRGLRVLDLSRVLAGPFATQQLIDLGAEVIKVEQPGGDPTRAWGPPFTSDGRSAYFLSCNRGKQSIVVDLKDHRGRDLVRRMARDVDVLIESFRCGQLDAWGLGLDTLRAANPRLATASITAFGRSGPRRDQGGYDALIQAMSGLMAITGPPAGPACKVGVAVIDLVAGLFSAQAILSALIARGTEQPWTSRHIDVALYDCALALLANVGSSALLTQQEPARHGNEHAAIVPYQVFAARDGELFVAVGNDAQWLDLAAAMQRDDWLAEKRWATNPGRVADRARLVATLAPEFARHACADVIARLQARGVPAGPVRGVLAALCDPVVALRRLITTHADGTRSITSPMRFDDRGADASQPAPRAGQHARAILASFGYAASEQAALIDAGVVVADTYGKGRGG
ncbi:MAG: CoA transferase [Planctomycetota bacterium]